MKRQRRLLLLLFVLPAIGCQKQSELTRAQARIAADATATVYLHCSDSPLGYALAETAAEREIREVTRLEDGEPQHEFVRFLDSELVKASNRFNLEHMPNVNVSGPTCEEKAAQVLKDSQRRIADFR